MVMRRAAGWVAGAAVVVAAAAAFGQGEAAPDAALRAEEANWSRTLDKVSDELLKRDLLAWADELAAKLDASDTPTLFVAADVFLRAGEPKRLSDAIARLGKTSAAAWPNPHLVDRMIEAGYFEPARLWYEAFPKCRPPGSVTPLVNWMLDRDGADRTEAWLAERVNRADTALYTWWSWTHNYLDFLKSRSKLAAHVESLAAAVRKDPADARGVVAYVEARERLDREKRPDAAWLAEVARLEHPLDAFYVARSLEDDAPAASIALYEASLKTPVTDYDRRWFSVASMSSMMVPPERVEAQLRSWTRAGLAQACFKTGHLARAQQLVEELTGKKDGTLENVGPYLFAGQVQGASGERVVEGRLKAAEEENKNSVRYWLNRAAYYKGRKEPAQVEDAYKAALALTADPLHVQAVRECAWYFKNAGRRDDAAKLLRDEIRRLGPGHDSADFLLQELDFAGEGLLAWDEPLVWEWVAARKARVFDQSGEGFLKNAARRSRDAGAWDAFEQKARDLAAEPCPATLRFAVGDLFYQHGKADDGLTMMLDAIERWPKEAARDAYQVRRHVTNVLLSRGDAERGGRFMARLLNDYPSLLHDTHWLSEEAATAARGGALDVAMDLWKRKCAMDLTEQRDLPTLAQHGLADRLREFYADLAKRAPDSRAVSDALEALPPR